MPSRPLAWCWPSVCVVDYYAAIPSPLADQPEYRPNHFATLFELVFDGAREVLKWTPHLGLAVKV